MKRGILFWVVVLIVTGVIAVTLGALAKLNHTLFLGHSGNSLISIGLVLELIAFVLGVFLAVRFIQKRITQ